MYRTQQLPFLGIREDVLLKTSAYFRKTRWHKGFETWCRRRLGFEAAHAYPGMYKRNSSKEERDIFYKGYFVRVSKTLAMLDERPFMGM